MMQKGLFSGLPLIFCCIVVESLATSQGSLKVIIKNSTDLIVVERNSTSEVYFSLSDIPDTTFNYIAVVSHKPPRTNISRLKCFLNKSLESCSSRATYSDCQCVDEDDGLSFRLRKDFQADDSGEWMFTISGKGFAVNKTVNISVVPRPPKLIIGNLIGHFKFEANKTSEIRFSVEDVASYILNYTLFINHRAPGTDISRLKCYLTKTDETCKSSSPDCRCLHGHQYKMAKAFREEDCGEWNFSVAGIGFSVKNGVHISIVAHSPETNQSVELCKLPERSLLKLSIDNTTGPFVIEHNSVSEVCFSVDHVENKLLSYTININHKAFGTHVSQLKCYLSKIPGKCSSDNEDCECLTEKAGHHQYRLKKVFDYEDSGEWTFTLSGQGLSFERAINITVMPGDNKSSNGSSSYSFIIFIGGGAGGGFVLIIIIIIVVVKCRKSRDVNIQNIASIAAEKQAARKSDSSAGTGAGAAGNDSKSGGSSARSSSSGSDKPSSNPNYTSTALQEVEIHAYMDLHTRDPTYAATASKKDNHTYIELRTKRMQSEPPQPPAEGSRNSAIYANQGRSPKTPVVEEEEEDETNYYNTA